MISVFAFKVASRDTVTENKRVMKLNAISLLMSALLIPISSGLISIPPDTGQDIMESLTALEDSEILFEDRMRIELKKGSKITYPTIGNGKDFNVILLGAAQFKIMLGYRLSVECNELTVKATAASFSIEKGNGTIDVIVTNNLVSIVTPKQNFVVRAFQRATYNVSTKRVTIIDTSIKRS